MLSMPKVCCFLAALVAAQPATAQEPSARPRPPLAEAQLIAGAAAGSWETLFLAASVAARQTELDRQAFWDSPEGTHAAATAQVIAERNPFTQAVLRIRGLDLAVWHERRPFDVDRALELNPEWLARIRDSTHMPDFRGRLPDKRAPHEVATDNAWCQAVLFANQTPLEAFISSADDNKYVTWGDLYADSERFRGKVVPVKGELLRLRRKDAPFRMQVLGVKFVYEAWIKGPTDKSTPFCVVFPIPAEDKSSPTGVLEPAEEMKRNVTFYGYYFKKLRYQVQEIVGGKMKTRYQDSPMLIGPTLILDQKISAITPPIAEPFSKHLYMIVGGLACIIIVLLGGLTWWFRRGDQQFRDRVRALHSSRAVEMFEDEPAPRPGADPGESKPHDP